MLSAALAAPSRATPQDDVPASQPAGSQPASRPSLEQAARAAAGAGDVERAAALWLELVALEPREIGWVIQASEALQRCGRFNDCLDLLERARQRFAKQAVIPIRIARTHKLEAESMARANAREIDVLFQLEEAARVAEEVLRQAPWEREPRIILAQCLLQLGRTDEALGHAEELVRRAPRDHAGHILAGDAHFANHARYRQEATAAAEPEAPAVLSQAARERAVAAYRQASALDPTRAYPHVQLGRIHAWANEREPARRAFATALALDPQSGVDHDWIHGALAPAERAEFYAEAAASYRAGSGARPEAAATLDWYRAFALDEAGDYALAYRLFDAAVTANPTYANSRCYAMVAAYRVGDSDGAQRQAALYAQQAPTHFADAIRARADAEQVIEILEFLARRSHEAKELVPCRDISLVLAKLRDTERDWNNYAYLCRETGALEQSLQAYETALSLAPDSPQLLNDTAVVLHYHLPSDQNLARAEVLYRKALACAAAVLGDPQADGSARESARRAKSDAERNLAALHGH
jgi:tetratricopeptide (TPR) repeat protein